MNNIEFSADSLRAIRPTKTAPECSPEKEYPPSEEEKIDLELRREQLKEVQNNNKLRSELPDRLWCLTSIWLIVVTLIMFFSGIQHDAFPGIFFLDYDPTVLIALITTTTASVLALFVILLNYLYPGNGPGKWPSKRLDPDDN